MECLKQTVIIMPISSSLSERKRRAKHDIDIINANAERFNKEAEEKYVKIQGIR